MATISQNEKEDAMKSLQLIASLPTVILGGALIWHIYSPARLKGLEESTCDFAVAEVQRRDPRVGKAASADVAQSAADRVTIARDIVFADGSHHTFVCDLPKFPVSGLVDLEVLAPLIANGQFYFADGKNADVNVGGDPSFQLALLGRLSDAIARRR